MKKIQVKIIKLCRPDLWYTVGKIYWVRQTLDPDYYVIVDGHGFDDGYYIVKEDTTIYRKDKIEKLIKEL